jgi:23S rRNA pseudouridine2604 synthase
MEEIIYPIRINRYLYLKNMCSRRQADKFIEQGMVHINGKVAVLGQKVNEKDKVTVAKMVERKKESFRYFLYYKPKGIVSHNPQGDEQTIEDVCKKAKGLYPIGRLDKASEGLMLLTNDTRIVDRMLNPKYSHEKEYRVRVDKELKESFQRKMERGVNIEGYVTKPCKVEITGPKSFKIILTEGKKHQIRRMTAALGYQVRELKRLRIMNLKIGNLIKNELKEIPPKIKFDLLKEIGVI